MAVPVPGRSSPLRVRAVPPSSVVPSADPWGSATFVDPQTLLPLASQTGAPSTPFGLVQDAADAGGNGDSIVLGPGDAGPLALVQKNFVYYGFGLLTQGNFALERVRIGDVTFQDPSGSNMQQRFVNVDVVGTIDLNDDGYLAGEGCYFEGAVSGVIFADLESCVLLSTITAAQVDAFQSAFSDVVTAAFVNLQLCQTGADVVATIACRFLNHTFAAGITVTSPSIELDSYSWQTSVTAGVTFSTTPRILDAFAAAEFYQTTLGGVSVATNPDNLMHPINSSNYGTVALASPSATPVWTLTPAACVATYSGPGNHRFRVTVSVASRATVAATFAYFAGAVDLQGDVIGDASFANLAFGEQQVQDAAPGSATQFATFTRIITPANGDTVQPAFGVGAGSEAVDLDLATLTMTIEGVT